MCVCVCFFFCPLAIRHGGAAVGGGGVERDSDAVCRRSPARAVPVVLPLPSRGIARRGDVSFLFFFLSPVFVTVFCPADSHPPLRLARRPDRGHTGRGALDPLLRHMSVGARMDCRPLAA